MDKNSAIGLTLIAALLLVYFTYFGPKPETVKPKPTQVEISDTTKRDVASPLELKADQVKSDSALAQQYGTLSSLLTGEEKTTNIETTDLAIKFSSHGAIIKELELRNFKTYYQKPLLLVSEANNSSSLLTKYEGKDVDLTKLYYTTDLRKAGDTTVLIFTAKISDNASIKQTYKIPATGFKLNYKLEAKGLALNDQNITLLWNDKIPLQEKDLTDSRNKTNINYYSVIGEFDNLSETATDLETDILANPIKWVSVRQKFFINSIIAKKSFLGGEVSTVANMADTTIVKRATVKLFIPGADVAAGAEFSYYFGPNDYDILSDVTEGFSKNLSLGWPPMLWITKYVLIPVFQFLERFFSNYGVIIMLLVLFVKLLLLPLSYKSYLGMAKMKLLKPELDLIKEKNGDNMTQNQQDQMKLYQQAGVNPFSGCIPLLLQMPILFAMFWFFPVAIQLRQQPFLWAEDLSTYDSIMTLPFIVPFGYGDHVSLFVILMTAATLLSTWQNNQMQSVQGPMKSMGYIMPLIFMFVLNSFSAGLSFYYFFSTIVTFAQQAIIKRFVDEDKIIAVMDDHKKKMEASAATGSKKSGFMSKLEQAMKTSEEARRKKSK